MKKTIVCVDVGGVMLVLLSGLVTGNPEIRLLSLTFEEVVAGKLASLGPVDGVIVGLYDSDNPEVSGESSVPVLVNAEVRASLTALPVHVPIAFSNRGWMVSLVNQQKIKEALTGRPLQVPGGMEMYLPQQILKFVCSQ